MDNSNFKWLVNDTYMSLVLYLYHDNQCYGTYEAYDIRDVVGSVVDVEFANIEDITNLLTLSVIRFMDIQDSNNFIDVPVRNMYMLYENGKKLQDSEEYSEEDITIGDIDAFSIIDGSSENNSYKIKSSIVSDATEDLKEVYEAAKKYGDLGMQERFDTLSNINIIGYRRSLRDKEKNR